MTTLHRRTWAWSVAMSVWVGSAAVAQHDAVGLHSSPSMPQLSVTLGVVPPVPIAPARGDAPKFRPVAYTQTTLRSGSDESQWYALPDAGVGDEGEVERRIASAVRADVETSPSTRSFVLQTLPEIEFQQFPKIDVSSEIGTMKQPHVETMMHWAAPRAVHRSLYYHDNALEREGKTNSPMLQPLISSLRFATDATLAPLRFTFRPWRHLHYATSPR